MIQIVFKLVLNPIKEHFELTIGQTGSPTKQWVFNAKETELLVKNAKMQLVDLTDAMTEFVLSSGDCKINITGVKSTQVIQGIVEYLEKVWNSFTRSEYYAKMYSKG